MRPISKDITKHYQIACSSGELHAICSLSAHVFYVLIPPFFLTHRSHYPGNRFKRSLSK